MGECFPEVTSRIEQMNSNRQKWQLIADGEDQAKKEVFQIFGQNETK